jgi:hypothetical protein
MALPGPLNALRVIKETDSGAKATNLARTFLPTPVLPFASTTKDAAAREKGQHGEEYVQAFINAVNGGDEAAIARSIEPLARLGYDQAALKRAVVTGGKNFAEFQNFNAPERKLIRNQNLQENAPAGAAKAEAEAPPTRFRIPRR